MHDFCTGHLDHTTQKTRSLAFSGWFPKGRSAGASYALATPAVSLVFQALRSINKKKSSGYPESPSWPS